MAAANGAVPQKQRLKYDPIALRQPREPELSGWRKFLRLFIHENVREVDRRDRWWGLTVWVLVLIAYGIYLLYLIDSRFEQRRHPPISVNVVEHKPLTAQAGVRILFFTPADDNTSINGWVLQVNFSTFYKTIDGDYHNGLNASSCHTCGSYSYSNSWGADPFWYLTLTEAFKGAPDEIALAGVDLQVSLSKNTTNNYSGHGSLEMNFAVGHSCLLRQRDSDSDECEKERITVYDDSTTIRLSKAYTFNAITFEADKVSKLPDRWQPSFSLPSWLTGDPGEVHKQWETWSYRLKNTEIELEEWGELGTSISLTLPEVVTIYEEQEPFDVLTMFGIAAGTWGAVVFVITLLLPMRPSGRRRIWPCCWRLSARLLRQENKEWDDKRRRDIHHEMDGDIEEEMNEVENQPGNVDIALLELPSMEDRMARTERVLRRLQNPSRPRKLKLRRLHQQRRQYKALRQKGRLFTAPLQQPHSSDEGSDSESDLEGSGGGGVREAKQ